MKTFVEVYSKLIGIELEGIAFMPMANADTPDVVADLMKSTFWFSGAVRLGFVGVPDFFLTWVPDQDTCALGITLKPLWGRFSLDEITMSPEEPWDALNRVTLRGLKLYTCDAVSKGKIVAVEHQFARGHLAVNFWVATCYRGKIGDGDDLIVGIDIPSGDRLNLIEACAL